MGVELEPLKVTSLEEIESEVRTAAITREHRRPSTFLSRRNVEAGGLMSYSPNFPGVSRRAATFVDKVLRGMKPSDLPVEEPTMCFSGRITA